MFRSGVPGSLLSVVLLPLCVAVPALAQSPPPAEISAKKLSGTITLDGKLDEPAWRDAPSVALTQQSPRPGQSMPYTTEIRVLATKDAVYFGLICHDPKPGAIAIHNLSRDGDQSGDDSVAIVLDTLGDHRTGYYFQINAAGARVDGLIATSESASLDWDGIWDARTAKTEDGWSAEIMIPSRTLNFAPHRDEWGLNVQRFIPRERMTLRWSAVTLDSFLYDLSRAGVLRGMGELQQGKGIEVSPY